MKRIVALHPELGLFIDLTNTGRPLFTHDAQSGAAHVVCITFDSVPGAVKALVLTCGMPNVMRYYEVEITNPSALYATAPELRRAGLGDWCQPLERNMLYHMEIQGHA